MTYLFKKNISLTMLILICTIIFLFSHQNGETSSNISDNFPIRKLAHFLEYSVLGFFSFAYISNFIKKKYLSLFYPLIFVIFYATSDEIHQLFIPRRSGNIIDIGIDALGGFFGILIANYFRK